MAAGSAVAELEWAVLDEQLVGDEFLAAAVVPWDHAGDDLASDVAVSDRDADPVADQQPLSAPGVLDVDPSDSDADEFTFFPCPREMLRGSLSEGRWWSARDLSSSAERFLSEHLPAQLGELLAAPNIA